MLVSEAIKQLLELLVKCDQPESLELFIVDDVENCFHIDRINQTEDYCVDMVAGERVSAD